MKKRILTIFLVIVSLFLFGCNLDDFEYGDDKFYLETVGTFGSNSTLLYMFRKKINEDMVLEKYSISKLEGYELRGEVSGLGYWYGLDIGNSPTYEKPALVIGATFLCYSKEGMGDAKLNIYFNYTVASTGERKEEVWEVDFGQKPFEDKRK